MFVLFLHVAIRSVYVYDASVKDSSKPSSYFLLVWHLAGYLRVMVFWECEYLLTLGGNSFNQSTKKSETKKMTWKICANGRGKSAKEANIFISIELDLWGNHMMQKRKTKRGNVKMSSELESCCCYCYCGCCSVCATEK